MNITDEGKKRLIEQLGNITNHRPLFYLKFCSCEKFAQDACNGDLYGNTAPWFRQREIETGERGQGDKFELKLSIQTNNITAIDNESENVIFTIPNGVFRFQYNQDDLAPIVSFVGIPLSDMQIIDVAEAHIDFMLPFTQDEYKTLEQRFGEFCVVFAARELEARIAAYCNHFDYDYIFDKVEYCNRNRIDRMRAFNVGAKERFLYKNEDLAYQREYRLAIGIETPVDHYIKIGKLNTAQQIDTTVLENMVFRVGYTSHSLAE